MSVLDHPKEICSNLNRIRVEDDVIKSVLNCTTNEFLKSFESSLKRRYISNPSNRVPIEE